ncbi:MAG TPA: serine hydrolase domain-containing protein [Pseudonocardiaceae bacterium]|nr:serine hydrolase domain-containing protein [Pseudonocardiaceae bacterium]
MSELEKQVQVLIDGLVKTGTENGVQVSVYQHGKVVVDAVAGDADTGRQVTSDTPFWTASTGKGVTATVAHVLVARGVLGYDTRVVEVWPEFGAHGKETTTLRHVLTHAAGVPAVAPDTTLEKLCDWDAMCAMIADTEPWWPPGEGVGYHAITFGYLVGEIVRRATGMRISQVLAEEVAGPLGIADELFFGTPESELHRVARLVDDPIGKAAFASLPDEWPLFKSAPREIFPNADHANRKDILQADIPYSATGTARAFARMYAALLTEVDGVRLVSPSRLGEISSLATTGIDEMTGAPATYALGYTVGLPWNPDPAADSTIFGMVGIGVGAAYADRATGVSIAVTKNRFNPIEVNAVEQVNDLVTKALS